MYCVWQIEQFETITTPIDIVEDNTTDDLLLLNTNSDKEFVCNERACELYIGEIIKSSYNSKISVFIFLIMLYKLICLQQYTHPHEQ